MSKKCCLVRSNVIHTFTKFGANSSNCCRHIKFYWFLTWRPFGNMVLPRDAMIAWYILRPCVVRLPLSQVRVLPKRLVIASRKQRQHSSLGTLKPRLHDTTCCQTGCHRLSNRFDNRLDNMLYRVYKHPTGCQAGLTTGCSVVQPDWQPAALCKQTSSRLSNRLYNRLNNRLSNRLYNRIDNRLYRVNGV